MLIGIDNQGSLSKYLTQVYSIPFLTREEEGEYARQKEKGDLDAVRMLVSSHLRLVVKIAYRYRNYGLSMMDMISEGNLGLLKAVRDFDLSKGCRLATYAMWWIAASIQDFILKSWSLVKIGTTTAQKKLFFNLKKLKDKIMHHDQRELSEDNCRHIADTLNVTVDEVAEMDGRLLKKDVYLNSSSNGSVGEAGELVEFLPSRYSTPEVTYARRREIQCKANLLRNSLGVLNEREREIILARRLTENPPTLRELSEKYHISGERIRQLEENAIRKMQHYVAVDSLQ
jgi:RNA polymerase sigma-32 factor